MQIHILPSWETIPDCWIWTVICYLLGHQYAFKLNSLWDGPNTHSHKSDSVHRTITHGDSHWILTSTSLSNSVSPHFTIATLPSFAYPFFSLLELSKQLKSKFISSHPLPPDWSTGLLSIKPPICIQIVGHKTLYTQYQTPVVIPSWYFTSLRCNKTQFCP